MFFLARCALCLGIVFYWMPWPSASTVPDPQSGEAIRGGTDAFVMTMGRKAAVKLGGSCARMPAECLSYMPNFTSMVSLANAVGVLPPRRPQPHNSNEPEAAHPAGGPKLPMQH